MVIRDWYALHLDLGWAAILVIVTAILLLGCASQQGAQPADAGREYRRIMDSQKQKATAREQAEIEKELQTPKDPEALERSGDVYLRQGKLELAFIEYSYALQADPKRVSVRQKVAALMIKKGLWADALREFEIVLKEDGANTRALQGKATALLHLDRGKEAEENLNRALSMDSGSWETYVLLGNTYDWTKRYKDAADAYEKAIAINPNAGPVYQSLGVSLYRSGKYRESANAFLAALKRDPSNLQSYNSLGLVLFKMGLYAESLEAFKKGGDEGSAYNSMGVLYMQDKKYEDAVDAFRKAIDAKPFYYKSAQIGLERARAALNQQKGTE
jgi:tetratricopeptide (TPR) repeat protein